MTSKLPTQIAQTNLQLYLQMRSAGFCSADLLRIHSAYSFAAQQCATLFRGSGKPFSCHLVGVASLCALVSQNPDCIAAALLHALYQPRVSLAKSNAFQQQRNALIKQFGRASERLVYGCFVASYDLNAHASQTAPIPEDLSSEELRLVKIILLADTLEDSLDAGLSLHGAPDDAPSVRGSAAWRLQRMQFECDAFLASAQSIGCLPFAELYQQLLRQNAERVADFAKPGPHTAQTSSFRID